MYVKEKSDKFVKKKARIKFVQLKALKELCNAWQ